MTKFYKGVISLFPILVELTEEKIKEAICKNFDKYCELLPHEHFQYSKQDGVKFLSSSISDVLFNRVVATNCNDKDLPFTLKEITSYYQTKNLPFMWMTWSDVDKPGNLAAYLAENDFESIESATGMALKLSELNEECTPISGLEIVKVQTMEDFERYCEVMKIGFEAAEEIAAGLTIMNELIVNQPEYGTLYLAYLYGKPVAISTVIYCAGVAGIYDVCTLKEARGKGIGRTMTLNPLVDAKSNGYQLAILHSSDLGKNLYKRIGFKEYYQIGMYVKKNSTDNTDPSL
jgi:ribosomal protein S18 acetylase RimI-like enzyme